MDGAEEKGIAEEKGPEASPEASPSLRALAVVILGEAMEETDKFSSEAVLADYQHYELVGSLEANPTGSVAHESAANVMSLISCMDNMHVESALAVKEGESELEFDFEMPSGSGTTGSWSGGRVASGCAASHSTRCCWRSSR